MSGLDRMIVDGLKAGIREEREAKAKADAAAEERTRIGNTPTELLDPESDEAEALFALAKDMQESYRDALHDLEEALGIEIDSTDDLQNFSTCAELVAKNTVE